MITSQILLWVKSFHGSMTYGKLRRVARLSFAVCHRSNDITNLPDLHGGFVYEQGIEKTGACFASFAAENITGR